MTNRMKIAVALVGLSSTATAQGTPPQTAAGQCEADATGYQAKKFSEMRTAGQLLTAENTTPIRAEARRMARECGARVSLDGASSAELIALSSLDMFAGDTAQAQAAITRLLALRGRSETERADALIAAERISIKTFDAFSGLNPDAEKYVGEIDAMSDEVLRQKIFAHELLLGRYEYADNDDGLRNHARKLLALATQAHVTHLFGSIPSQGGAPPTDSAYTLMATAFSSLARGEGDFLHADSAIKIIDNAISLLAPHLPAIHAYLDDQRAMYALVGTKATPIDGKWWINAADGSTFQPGKAQVTVIQFTAHWCVPCRNSYPGFMRMNARFAGQPVESIMVTDLYGFFGDKRSLPPAEEVSDDRDYYLKEHGLPFKVAINPSLARGDTVTRDNDRRYAVNGIPEIIVVDEKGIIRATVIGWDKGNEQRLSALIYRILDEKKKK